ncbi:tRNA (guanine-N(1)-)-methyltransferase [Mucisphaera calidilacus]|uniref:tRNA (guanine-N(1)-)-methyltransferase n=1 Tax=Mucisphaera calidilacus TaxID=2527982 RepID=A0A518BZL5_9BACT|nr:tRNA (guanosine(37)-N1)-methyltransferase TrmD [Mucisphaera calidilacus]QDU72410.1 tRNA (guanine-N(1)-)-methyltransferase [Mucisphaera calidilacus]
MTRRIDILTLFPDMFPGILGSSILKRAAETVTSPADPALTRDPVVSYHLTNIRDYTDDKHQKVDQPPFGGGPGMVIQCQPVYDAVRAAENADPRPARRILMTPQGRPLTQKLATELAAEPRLIILAGHYEGIDERVIEELAPVDEISIGDYVLSGGELPALVLIDAIVRLIPGALGHEDSAAQDSFTGSHASRLEGPAYTRPRLWHNREVPDVLLSGDHARIAEWRDQQALVRTRERRPDLLLPTPSDQLTTSSQIITIRHFRRKEAKNVEIWTKTIQNGLFSPFFNTKWTDFYVDLFIADTPDTLFGVAGLVSLALSDEPSLRGLLGITPLILAPEAPQQPLKTALIRELTAAADQAGAAALLIPDDQQPDGFEPASQHNLSIKSSNHQQLWLKPLRPAKLATLTGTIDWPTASGP